MLSLLTVWLLVLVILTAGSRTGWLGTDYGWDGVALATAALIAFSYGMIVQGLDVLIGLRYPRGTA